jgi:hypothetical protein
MLGHIVQQGENIFSGFSNPPHIFIITNKQNFDTPSDGKISLSNAVTLVPCHRVPEES